MRPPPLRRLYQDVVETVLKHKKPEKIIVFGSRATGKSRKTSDVDIAVLGKDWSDTDINIVRFDLNEDVKTPLKFDVLNFYALQKNKLKEAILKQGLVIYDDAKDR